MTEKYVWVVRVWEYGEDDERHRRLGDRVAGVAANSHRAKLMALSVVADEVKAIEYPIHNRDMERVADACFMLAQISDGTEFTEQAFTTRHVVRVERKEIQE